MQFLGAGMITELTNFCNENQNLLHLTVHWSNLLLWVSIKQLKLDTVQIPLFIYQGWKKLKVIKCQNVFIVVFFLTKRQRNYLNKTCLNKCPLFPEDLKGIFTGEMNFSFLQISYVAHIYFYLTKALASFFTSQKKIKNPNLEIVYLPCSLVIIRKKKSLL